MTDHRGPPAKRRIGEDHVVALAGVGLERVIDRDRALGVPGADPVQRQVHHAQAGDAIDDVDAPQGVETQMPLLIRVEVGVGLGDVLVPPTYPTGGQAR